MTLPTSCDCYSQSSERWNTLDITVFVAIPLPIRHHSWLTFNVVSCDHSLRLKLDGICFLISIIGQFSKSICLLTLFWQQLLAAHTDFKKNLANAQQEYNAIVAIDTEASAIAQDGNLSNKKRNPYSSLTIQVIHCSLNLCQSFKRMLAHYNYRLGFIAMGFKQTPAVTRLSTNHVLGVTQHCEPVTAAVIF